MSATGGGYAIMLVRTPDRKLKLYGCPGGPGDLSEADEIFEVNGRSLENWIHSDISDYVQRCIYSRAICLRIKPKKTQEPARDVTVQETFLISVGGVTPEERSVDQPDMTQLSGGRTPTQPTTPRTHHPTHTSTPNESDPLTKGTRPIPILPKDSNSVTTTKTSNGCVPSVEIKSEDRQEVESTIKETQLPLIKKIDNITPSNVKELTIIPAASGDINMALVQQAPPVRHREMAVDVPDSFIAVTKTTPRYPPPKRHPNQDTSSLKKNGLYYFSSDNARTRHERSSSSQDGSEGSRRTPPTPRISELVRDASEEVESKVTVNGNVIAQKDTISDDTKGLELEHMERIRKYQEDIRKRKEEEERQAKEDDFLRSSLRGSKKLRALEKKYQLDCGVENTAFQLEEGDVADQGCSEGKLVGDVPEGEPPELKKIFQPSELMDMLHNIEANLAKSNFDGDLVLVEKLIHNAEFQSMLSLHNKIQDLCCFNCLPVPANTEAHDISQEIINDLQDVPSKDAKELIDILSLPEFENLLICHDEVAESQITPDVTEEEELLTRVSQYTEESIKIVRVDKTTEPLGATVKNEGEAVVIGRIVKGGVAEKSGLLHEGDEILEVNGIEMRGKSVNDVCDIMASMSGTLTFLIVPSQFECPKQQSRETVIHLKAHFDYEPDDDLYIPCRELGMSFQKGDVLHIIGQEDPNWWQAYREGEEDQMLAGLIPSKNFQQQREVMKQAVVGDTRERKSKKGKFLCARRHHRRKKKKLYNLNYNDDTDADQILTYEDVCLYYPRAHHKRPLVLIGPQKVGRHELRQRLMEDTNRFAAAVPHTSRTKKDSEVNGVDYHFISRAQFEADIVAGRFVEHGEYQKSYYGTSLDAIRSVINAGKTCVLNLHPQSLKILKKSDLKPYVVFIAPPSLEKLRQNCIKTDTAVKDDELKDIIEKAREIEEFYGHYFDMVLINVDIEKTYSELLHEISVIEREPQWVPGSWMKDDTT